MNVKEGKKEGREGGREGGRNVHDEGHADGGDVHEGVDKRQLPLVNLGKQAQ